MRNNVTSQLRKENIELNNNRVSEANDDNEIWRIVKEVTNPQKSSAWSIKIGDTNTMDEKVISETFNEYFRWNSHFQHFCIYNTAQCILNVILKAMNKSLSNQSKQVLFETWKDGVDDLLKSHSKTWCCLHLSFDV